MGHAMVKAETPRFIPKPVPAIVAANIPQAFMVPNPDVLAFGVRSRYMKAVLHPQGGGNFFEKARRAD